MQITPAVNQIVNEGKNISFTCSSTTSPASVVWTTADGSPFDSNVHQQPGGILSITSATVVNEKQYLCTLSNYAGNRSKTVNLTVTRKS